VQGVVTYVSPAAFATEIKIDALFKSSSQDSPLPQDEGLVNAFCDVCSAVLLAALWSGFRSLSQCHDQLPRMRCYTLKRVPPKR